MAAYQGKGSRQDAPRINQGLNDLYVPPTDQNTDPSRGIDIIAVGGLGAVPGKTWTYHNEDNSVNVNWLKDKETMLPKRFPKARIMEFHYPSAYYGKGAVNQTLQPIAEALLKAIKNKRKDCPRRPIIFIAHCLGGIVVEKAICIAKAHPEEWKAVFTAIAGVTFLSTPFLGTRTESKAAFMNSIMHSINNQGSETDLLPLLEPNSPRLQELREEFLRIVDETRIMVYCFYETLKSHLERFLPRGLLRKMVSFEELVVSKDSSTLPGKASGYLTKDHFSINKFTGPSDGCYMSVQAELDSMIRKAPVFVKGRVQDVQRSLVPDDKYFKILEQFNPFNCDEILNQVEKARPDMFRQGSGSPCTFVLDTEEWKTWLTAYRNKSKALWVSSKKGQGKTLFAVEVVKKFKDKFSEDTENGQNLFAYCFCDGNKPETSSASNVLKVIVAQILRQNRDMAKYFLSSNKSAGSSSYTVSTLLQRLVEISKDPSIGTVFVMIEGLEAVSPGPDRDELLRGLYQLLKPQHSNKERNRDNEEHSKPNSEEEVYSTIKLLILSSILNDDIAAAMVNAVSIDLTSEKYKTLVVQGLNADFSQRIGELARKRQYGPSLEYLVKTYIKWRAQSESIWVTLACGELDTLDVPKPNIRNFLEELPPGYSALFQQILSRILGRKEPEIKATNKEIEVTKEFFRCMLLAKREVNLDELAVMAGLSDDERADRYLIQNSIRRCAPFVILDPDDYTVQFVMPEVSELFKSFAWKTLFPLDASQKLQHGLIALRCFEYLLNRYEPTKGGAKSIQRAQNFANNAYEDEDEESEEASRGDISTGDYIPEVAYPENHWLDHCKEAEIDMLDSFDLDTAFWQLSSKVRNNWWRAFTEENSEYRKLTNLSSLHLAAFFGFDAFIDHLLERGRNQELEAEDSWGNRPLYWACRNGFESCVARMIGAGAKVDGHKQNGGLTPLYGAAYYGNNRIVKELISRGANVNFYDENNGSPLYIAMAGGYSDTIRTLLAAGANVDLGTDGHKTPLQGAIWSAQPDLVRFVLDKGVDPNFRGKKFSWSPLWHACDLGHHEIVDILLQRGADVNWCSTEYSTPLAVSARGARIDTVRSLLRARPNPTSQQDALREASWSGSAELVTLLLNYNPRLALDEAFVRASSVGDNEILKTIVRYGRISQPKLDEALYTASDGELEETVNLLLSLRANPNARGRTYGSALAAACFDGSVGIVQSLIKYGANVNISGGNYGSPLQAACFRADREVVYSLLSQGAHPNSSVSGQYGTALQAASVSGSEDIVKLLLQYGADINARGGEYGTALRAAAYCRHQHILKILIDRGADINLTTEAYQAEPVLQIAANALPASTVQMLLDHGAKVDLADSIGYTPLMAAAVSGDSEATKILLDHGANPNATTIYGTTPLLQGVESGSLDVCKLLVEHGAKVDRVTDDWRGTPLQRACFHGNEQLFDYLIDQGANINVQSGRWGNCLQAAALRSHSDFVTKVLEAGANINAVGGKYHTALAAAAYACEGPVVDLLIEKNADASITGGFYGSALGSAAAMGFAAITDSLLSHTPDNLVVQALWQSVLYRRAQITQKLLMHITKIEVTSEKLAYACKALDQVPNFSSNVDDDPVFEGYNVTPDEDEDDSAETAQNSEENGDDDEDEDEEDDDDDDDDEDYEDENSYDKEEGFKTYWNAEFGPVTVQSAVVEQPELDLDVKRRETKIRQMLSKEITRKKRIEDLNRSSGNTQENGGFTRQMADKPSPSPTVSGYLNTATDSFGGVSSNQSNSIVRRSVGAPPRRRPTKESPATDRYSTAGSYVQPSIQETTNLPIRTNNQLYSPHTLLPANQQPQTHGQGSNYRREAHDVYSGTQQNPNAENNSGNSNYAAYQRSRAQETQGEQSQSHQYQPQIPQNTNGNTGGYHGGETYQSGYGMHQDYGHQSQECRTEQATRENEPQNNVYSQNRYGEHGNYGHQGQNERTGQTPVEDEEKNTVYGQSGYGEDGNYGSQYPNHHNEQTKGEEKPNNSANSNNGFVSYDVNRNLYQNHHNGQAAVEDTVSSKRFGHSGYGEHDNHAYQHPVHQNGQAAPEHGGDNSHSHDTYGVHKGASNDNDNYNAYHEQQAVESWRQDHETTHQQYDGSGYGENDVEDDHGSHEQGDYDTSYSHHQADHVEQQEEEAEEPEHEHNTYDNGYSHEQFDHDEPEEQQFGNNDYDTSYSNNHYSYNG